MIMMNQFANLNGKILPFNLRNVTSCNLAVTWFFKSLSGSLNFRGNPMLDFASRYCIHRINGEIYIFVRRRSLECCSLILYQRIIVLLFTITPHYGHQHLTYECCIICVLYRHKNWVAYVKDSNFRSQYKEPLHTSTNLWHIL